MSVEELEREMKGLGGRKGSAIGTVTPGTTLVTNNKILVTSKPPAASVAQMPAAAGPPQRRMAAAAIKPLLPPGPMTAARTDEVAKLILLKLKEMRTAAQVIQETPVNASQGDWEERKQLWESAVSYVVRGLNQHQAEGAVAPGSCALPRDKVEAELRENHIKCKKRFEEVANAHGRDKYKAMFERLDKDGSGALDMDELKKAMHGLGVVLSDTNQCLILGRVDRDGNGSIDFNEFQLSPYGDLLALLIEVRKMFRDTDTDQSGIIDDAELEDCFSRLGFFKYSPSLFKMFKAMFDSDNSGLIEFQEFFNFVLFYKELDEAFEKKRPGYAKHLLGVRATPTDCKNCEEMVNFKILSFESFVQVIFQKYLELTQRK